MAYQFTDEDKVENERGNYFDFGVHKVKLSLFEVGATDENKPFIEVSFCHPEDGDMIDSARLWFVGGATNISFNTLRQIAVHNVPADKKDAVRDAVGRVKDIDELVALLNEKLIGGEAWFTKYVDPKRTYQDSKGATRQSVNKNVLGYEPKLNKDFMPKPTGKDQQVTSESIDTIFPGNEPFPDTSPAAASIIPKADDWMS